MLDVAKVPAGQGLEVVGEGVRAVGVLTMRTPSETKMPYEPGWHDQLEGQGQKSHRGMDEKQGIGVQEQ